ncbi:MAG: leucine-rich repeat domain-containing protein, partial [Treponema sp.]|nr:leucine-rich repeat domain-containing protein [Treponema sp.]
GLRSIGESAFEGCSSLKSLHLSEYLTTIEYCAFARCENLRSVSLYEMTSVEDAAFDHGVELHYYEEDD